MSLGKSQKRSVGRPALPNPVERQREYVKNYRKNEKQRKAYMEQVTAQAEALNKALKQASGSQIALPLSLVSDDVRETLQNIWMHVEAENSREAQNKRTKRAKR
jgi:hypothetical protein